MKKTTFFVLVAVLISGIGLAPLLFAEEVQSGEEMKSESMQPPAEPPMKMEAKYPGPGMMGGKMMKKGPMDHNMMQKMMQKTVVATSDGGVVVVAGNKIMKYDKDLNLVKGTEMKIDMTAMQKEMMKQCPMMKGQANMSQGAGPEQGNPPPPVEAVSAPAADVAER